MERVEFESTPWWSRPYDRHICNSTEDYSPRGVEYCAVLSPRLMANRVRDSTEVRHNSCRLKWSPTGRLCCREFDYTRGEFNEDD